MRPSSVTLSAVGASPWIPLNRNQTPFNVGIGVTLSNGASATYTVQHTFSEMQAGQVCNITRSGTTATLTLVDHGLTTADSITIYGSGSSNLDGTYTPASISSADVLTYTVANTGVTTAVANALPIVVYPNATAVNLTADADTNYAFPVTAIRLNLSVYASGKVTMTHNQGWA